jgi:ABC-type antimicrobial peptide transport system permease subunit
MSARTGSTSRPATVYWPAFSENLYGPGLTVTRNVTFAIRTPRAGTEGFLNQVREAVWSVNASLPVAAERTMQDIYDRSLERTSFTLVMLALAGAMALGLGLVGIYGVIAYSVSQRRREIGIRLALGAQQGDLKRMFVRDGVALALIGVAFGLGAAAALTRLMSPLLFGVGAIDPVTYAAVALILLTSAMLSSYLPARRAARVDPVEALGSE